LFSAIVADPSEEPSRYSGQLLLPHSVGIPVKL